MKKTLFTILFSIILTTAGISQNGDHNYGDEQEHFNHMGQIMNHNLVFPHITMGQGYQTKLTLMNPGIGTDITGTLFFYSQDGSELQVNYQDESVSSIQLTIPQGGFESIILGQPNESQTRAWAVFINNDDFSDHSELGHDMNGMFMGDHLFGGIIYSRYQETLVTQVGLMATQFMDGMHMGFAIPVTNDQNNVSGLVLLNSSETALVTELTLKEKDGTVVFTKSLELAPGQQIVDIVANYFLEFNGITEFYGILELRSEFDGLVPLALVNTNGIQTAIPFVRIPDAMDMLHDHGTGGMN